MLLNSKIVATIAKCFGFLRILKYSKKWKNNKGIAKNCELKKKIKIYTKNDYLS